LQAFLATRTPPNRHQLGNGAKNNLKIKLQKRPAKWSALNSMDATSNNAPTTEYMMIAMMK
jgi:hypothetical protein